MESTDYKKKYIFENINMIENHNKIVNFINYYKIKHTENSNGYFINISVLDNGLIEILYKLINDSSNNVDDLEKGKNKIIFIAFFLFIHHQPIAGGPAVTGRNIQRLCALGLPFLLPLIFTARIELKNLYLFLSSSLLLSFHHNFSFLYYLGFGKTLFFSVILLNFAASLLVNKRQLKFSRDS